MMRRQSAALSSQSDFFGLGLSVPISSAMPEEFVYRDGLVSPEEERELVQYFKLLPFKPFEFHGFLGKRQVVSFGWRYDFAGRALRVSDPIPVFLLPLRQKVADFARVPLESLEQILINEYGPAAGIGWHRDKPMFQDVVAVFFSGALFAAPSPQARRRLGAGIARCAAAIGLPPARAGAA